ncbi:hypothetical protein BGX29_005276 [Mortierella sp. GBA35]|nr:hypothetical protein BGX23_003205 [Mortierella sp. AD031]KAF9101773.1 hypothetical protein BGX29_005276 [Mortierella sp. GBA35]KAG0211827.1 hypothetical protein BGX33_004020 [Mortierella sp. NVP41]
MSETIAAKPTPFSQFCLFKSLSLSLFEDDWFNMVESWQAMVAVNAPIPEFAYNMAPFFANAPRLLPIFYRYLGYAEQDNEFLTTLTTVVMSTPLLIKVQQILKSTELFSSYIVALKLDNPSASHTQVMQSLQTFLSVLPENKRLEILKVFAEQEASDSMGFTTSTLDKALQVIHADTQLYIDILSTLQLNQTENMPWDAVVNKVKALVLSNKPQAWAGVDQFLKSLHWGHKEETITTTTAAAAAATRQLDVENDDDEIVEMVEGVDYYPDEEDEVELESFPEGEEYDHDYAAFLQDVQEIQAGRQVMGGDFGKMSLAVETC